MIIQNSTNNPEIATLTPIHFLYTTISKSIIRLQTLTYLQFITINQLYKKHENLFHLEIVKQSLETPQDINYLTIKDVNKLSPIILSKTILTQKQLNSISQILDVLEDEKYQTKDFLSCKICQDKGLDKRRNCPLLDKSLHDKSTKFIINNQYTLTTCPTYPLHYYDYIQDVFTLRDILSLNTLPLSGGLLNQTPFVYSTSLLLKPLIEKRRMNLNSLF